MSRKHFEEFAAALATITLFDERSRATSLVADVCGRCNPRFDRTRFVVAVEALARGERPHGFSASTFEARFGSENAETMRRLLR